MASLIDLENAVKALLSSAGARGILQLNSYTQERAYEAYIFSLCTKAVLKLGGTVSLIGINSGKNPNPIVFRGSPGVIYSKAQDFAYALCSLNGKEFEIHADVQFLGQSSASHEIDISLVQHDAADRCRKRLEYPGMSQHLIGAIECKFYFGNPGVSLARTFAGLLSDASSNRVEAFVYNRSSDDIGAFFSKLNSSNSFDNLVPSNAIYEDMFVNYIMLELSKWSKRKN